MSIEAQILGQPGKDNALFVRVDTGQAIYRLLMDCGEGVLAHLPIDEVQQIDHVCFSHFHMDHICGWDSFFRANFDRGNKPNRVWGPPGLARVIHHRQRGYEWNLIKNDPGTWLLHEIHPDCVRTFRTELAERFEFLCEIEPTALGQVLIAEPTFVVRCRALDHRIPSIAYRVDELPRWNIVPEKLIELRLPVGPWLRQVRDFTVPSETQVFVGEKVMALGELRRQLLVATPGQSVAYLTDFGVTEKEIPVLAEWLQNCQTIFCESQYLHEDYDLAQKNRHLTARLAGQIAATAGAKQLVLFHLSARYYAGGWQRVLKEAQEVFPAAQFPEHWAIN